MTTIRVMLSLVAMENLHFEQINVKINFLHCDLEVELYIEQPQDYVAQEWKP